MYAIRSYYVQDLKVTLIQSELAWEDIDSNLAGFNSRMDAIEEDTHLIVLPEMFSTGFTMNAAELAQDMKGSARITSYNVCYTKLLREEQVSYETEKALSGTFWQILLQNTMHIRRILRSRYSPESF